MTVSKASMLNHIPTEEGSSRSGIQARVVGVQKKGAGDCGVTRVTRGEKGEVAQE